jgi:hypothetical protein
VVKYEENGSDRLPAMHYSVKHFVFTEYYAQNTNPAPDQPSERLSKPYSMSGIGLKLSVGIQVSWATRSGKVI